MSIDNLNQILALLFSAVAVYFSFRDLNACGPFTCWYVRFPLLFMFASSAAVLLAVSMGVVLHWMTTLITAALAVKLASERRRDTPFMTPAMRQAHIHKR